MTAWWSAHWLELTGAVLGALCVGLALRESVWNWWVGIANNLIYLIVFAESRLFGDAALQLFFIAISVYGIVRWLHGGEHGEPAPIRLTPRREALLMAAALVVATAGLTAWFERVDDAAPFLDALTTAGSIVAQYGLARKYLENWYVWIAVDVVSIGLYAWKGLALTSALNALYLAMCVLAVVQWRRSMRLQPA